MSALIKAPIDKRRICTAMGFFIRLDRALAIDSRENRASLCLWPSGACPASDSAHINHLCGSQVVWPVNWLAVITGENPTASLLCTLPSFKTSLLLFSPNLKGPLMPAEGLRPRSPTLCHALSLSIPDFGKIASIKLTVGFLKPLAVLLEAVCCLSLLCSL